MKTSLVRAQGKVTEARKQIATHGTLTSIAAAVLALADAIDELTKVQVENELLEEYSRKHESDPARKTGRPHTSINGEE